MNRALWVVQGLLAVYIFVVGLTHLLTPLDVLVQQKGMPGALIRFIGVAEVLAAIGLIVPAVTRIRPSLVPLAAAGLIPITLGAVVFHLSRGEYFLAPIPALVALLSAFVANGRWRVIPHGRVEHPRRPPVPAEG
jgi:hypothetical protein